ncbi:MAG: DUF167 domain-containing protein [Candidatus Omnitrophica bacterium]|nr:DUF167 domain-containing protein [Candidatus Omnitrophota bacterium]
MKLVAVKVIPKSSRVRIESAGKSLKIYLTRPAENNQANNQLLEVLADYLHLKRYQIKIVQGRNSRNKVIQIEDGIKC